MNFTFRAFGFIALIFSVSAIAQDSRKTKKKKKAPEPFSWVSRMDVAWEKKSLLPNVKHATFKSPSMNIDVGYYIYLPDEYKTATAKKFPVVFHLHGGRPGAEKKSVKLTPFIHEAIRAGKVEPKIYVFPNGGPMSWYNYPKKENGLGEDVFVNELVPHIDATYRTFGTRAKRGIEGFSQGGRGTTRIIFRHPELFASAAPGGSGYEPEKRIQENNGAESENVIFAPGDNAWDLAKQYAARKNAPKLKPMLWVGTKGFNYEYNLKFSAYLDELGVPHEKLIVPDATHSAAEIYEAKGVELMQFHDRNFAGKK